MADYSGAKLERRKLGEGQPWLAEGKSHDKLERKAMQWNDATQRCCYPGGYQLLGEAL